MKENVAAARFRPRSPGAGWRTFVCCAVWLAVAAGVPGFAGTAGSTPASIGSAGVPPASIGSAGVPPASIGSAGGSPAQWAIIINGDDSFTHNRNVEISLSSLAKLGYSPANTFLLSANPRPPEGGGAVLRGASRRALSATLAALKARMHSSDLLLIYLTGHGIRFFGHAVLELESGSIGAGALAHDVAALPFDRLILIADQCYSGAFVKAFAAIGRNVIAVSSADETHEVRCEPFIRTFWSAAVDVERSRDVKGYVSVEDAFRVAKESLAAGAGEPAGVTAQYAATGTCRGGGNRFAAGPPRASDAAARMAVQKAPGPGSRK